MKKFTLYIGTFLLGLALLRQEVEAQGPSEGDQGNQQHQLRDGEAAPATGKWNQFKGFYTPRPMPEQSSYLFASVWAAWSAWSFCTEGVQMRVRACNTVRGFSCLGPNKEQKPCELEETKPSDRRFNVQPVVSDRDYEGSDPWVEDRHEAMKQLAQGAERQRRLELQQIHQQQQQQLNLQTRQPLPSPTENGQTNAAAQQQFFGQKMEVPASPIENPPNSSAELDAVATPDDYDPSGSKQDKMRDRHKNGDEFDENQESSSPVSLERTTVPVRSFSTSVTLVTTTTTPEIRNSVTPASAQELFEATVETRPLRQRKKGREKNPPLETINAPEKGVIETNQGIRDAQTQRQRVIESINRSRNREREEVLYSNVLRNSIKNGELGDDTKRALEWMLNNFDATSNNKEKQPLATTLAIPLPSPQASHRGRSFEHEEKMTTALSVPHYSKFEQRQNNLRSGDASMPFRRRSRVFGAKSKFPPSREEGSVPVKIHAPDVDEVVRRKPFSETNSKIPAEKGTTQTGSSDHSIVESPRITTRNEEMHKPELLSDDKINLNIATKDEEDRLINDLKTENQLPRAENKRLKTIADVNKGLSIDEPVETKEIDIPMTSSREVLHEETDVVERDLEKLREEMNQMEQELKNLNAESPSGLDKSSGSMLKINPKKESTIGAFTKSPIPHHSSPRSSWSSSEGVIQHRPSQPSHFLISPASKSPMNQPLRAMKGTPSSSTFLNSVAHHQFVVSTTTPKARITQKRKIVDEELLVNEEEESFTTTEEPFPATSVKMDIVKTREEQMRQLNDVFLRALAEGGNTSKPLQLSSGDGEWSQWSPWGICVCGKQMRNRVCQYTEDFPSRGCKGKSYETQSCLEFNKDQCRRKPTPRGTTTTPANSLAAKRKPVAPVKSAGVQQFFTLAPEKGPRFRSEFKPRPLSLAHPLQ